MRKTIRLGVGAVAGLTALAFASQAFASYTPSLAVQQDSGATTIHLTIPSGDDPTAKLTFFAPAGTTASLSAASGSTLGSLDAKATAAALGGATLPLTGTVQARAADGTYLSSGVAVPLAKAATLCTGSATHAAFWVLVLSAAGQTLEVPIFVDPTSGAVAAAAAYTLTLCLPPSDIPESLGGAAFGAKVFEANFTVKGVFTPTSATNVWRLLATPYTPAKGTPNIGGTVEAQSYVETGTVSVRILSRLLTAGTAVYQAVGSVKVKGLPDTRASVSLARGAVANKLVIFAHPTVGAAGGFTAKFAVKRTKRNQKLFLAATATAPQRDLGASACKATFGVPCIGATASGFKAVSNPAGLFVPKTLPPRKKKK
jgi:hypothetical protein